jgi:hypothetical protein
MKRTPLKRTKPLSKGAMKSWNSTLPKQSAKKRKELRETDEIRHTYIEAGLPCENCGTEPSEHPHEITAGSYRHNAVYQPNAQLYLCAACHKKVQGNTYAAQIAVRVKAMIRAVNECRGCTAVTVNKVIIALGGQPK